MSKKKAKGIPIINTTAAGIDIGSRFHVVAVPHELCDESVKTFQVETMTRNTWWRKNPNEYGFYANVNPQFDHPRWSQASERVIGNIGRQRTLLFNGYADQVAHLYPDLGDRRYFY